MSGPAPTRAIDPRTLRHMPLEGDLREVFGINRPTKGGRPVLKLPKKRDVAHL